MIFASHYVPYGSLLGYQLTQRSLLLLLEYILEQFFTNRIRSIVAAGLVGLLEVDLCKQSLAKLSSELASIFLSLCDVILCFTSRADLGRFSFDSQPIASSTVVGSMNAAPSMIPTEPQPSDALGRIWAAPVLQGRLSTTSVDAPPLLAATYSLSPASSRPRPFAAIALFLLTIASDDASD